MRNSEDFIAVLETCVESALYVLIACHKCLIKFHWGPFHLQLFVNINLKFSHITEAFTNIFCFGNILDAFYKLKFFEASFFDGTLVGSTAKGEVGAEISQIAPGLNMSGIPRSQPLHQGDTLVTTDERH